MIVLPDDFAVNVDGTVTLNPTSTQQVLRFLELFSLLRLPGAQEDNEVEPQGPLSIAPIDMSTYGVLDASLGCLVLPNMDVAKSLTNTMNVVFGEALRSPAPAGPGPLPNQAATYTVPGQHSASNCFDTSDIDMDNDPSPTDTPMDIDDNEDVSLSIFDDEIETMFGDLDAGEKRKALSYVEIFVPGYVSDADDYINFATEPIPTTPVPQTVDDPSVVEATDSRPSNVGMDLNRLPPIPGWIAKRAIQLTEESRSCYDAHARRKDFLIYQRRSPLSKELVLPERKKITRLVLKHSAAEEREPRPKKKAKRA
ncbi:hypothetical protein DFH11DRAFT_1747928 [Phellopilus nigrolimitatus]|nr:hypothetical protein DFH11DRAFT_1882991 [Phellopilus nigrolimitatus]KAH8107610.1 hypothetical protein DFH11DRAFT_1747928 [Phellopilus nigrolimitatus]